METTNRPMSLCFHCGRTFDPVKSTWCDCLSQTRSLTCPSCQKCSCAAPASWISVYGVRSLRPKVQACEQASDLLSGSRPLAVVAEDQQRVRTMLCQILSPTFDVIVAESGSAALVMVQHSRPALLVTDALMPGLDGRELSRLVKSDPSTASTKVVLLTGLYRSVKHANEAVLVYKVDAVLAKPISSKTLLETIDRLLPFRAAMAATA